MKRLLVATITVAALSSCRDRAKPATRHDAASATQVVTNRDPWASDDVWTEIKAYEQQAAIADAERQCEGSVAVYTGAISVSSNTYVHSVERGSDFIDEPIDGLDRVLTKSTRVQFTLDYPFERPFRGSVTGDITLRRTIDAIRAGFRRMYDGSAQRDIPKLHNKEVTGPYGRAFHVIDDLFIERIELCADDTLSISIGS